MAQPIQNLISLLNRQTIEEDLTRLARNRLGEDETLDREVGHLVDVLTNPVLLVTSLYDLIQLSHLEDGGPLPLENLRFWKNLHSEEPEVIHRVMQAPDTMKSLGDKCLFDHAVTGGAAREEFDLESLGTRAYERASQVLELLADDRQLRSFYESNRYHNLSLPEEIAFLHGCADKFGLYGEMLQEVVSTRIRCEQKGEGKQDQDGAGTTTPSPESRASTLLRPRIDLGRTMEPEPPDESDGGAATSLVDGGEQRDPATLLTSLERWVLFSSLDVECLRRRLEQVVVNQSEAIERLCDDLCLFGTGTADPKRPSSYFLIGPTGVGKNYLVEQLVEGFRSLWDIQIPYVLIEGPQYTYPSDINELKGAARGFIRSDEEGILTEFHKKSSRSPLAIVLIDEVEKAHPQLRRFFLSVMDRGTITDNRGEVLDFSNTIFFYTSNVGYSDIARRTRAIGYGGQEEEDRRFRQDLTGEIRRQLSPEFMNRVTMLHFNYLARTDAERIFDLEFEKISGRYSRNQGIEIRCTGRARNQVMDMGFDRDYGARNLAQVLNQVVNIGVSRRLRRDHPSGCRDVSEILEAIREMRESDKEMDLASLELAARESARVRVLYRVIEVDFVDGEFVFQPR